MGFVRDLSIGNKGQQFVIEIFESADIPVKPNTDRSKLKFFDIEFFFANKDWKAEIKYDLYAEKSGNIAIEFFNPKLCKPSGISITKADFWIHVLTNPNRAFIVNLKEFREFIDAHKPDRIIVSGGDNNASLYLYRADFMMENIFVPINKENIKETIKVLTYE